jgi:hypothetical protein
VAVRFVGVGPDAEEATEDAARRVVDFAVARTGLDREEAYMLLSIIGELRVGTSPRPVMATWLIVPRRRCGLPAGAANCSRYPLPAPPIGRRGPTARHALGLRDRVETPSPALSFQISK